MRKILTLILLALFATHVVAQERLAMTYVNGTFTLPCEINGTPLTFIFDTGAADVSLSKEAAQQMLKSGALSKDDFSGSQAYRLANGELEDNALVNLRELKIGNHTLRNVQACVSPKMRAALLLGMSAIRRLGRITLDGQYLYLDESTVVTEGHTPVITGQLRYTNSLYEGEIVDGKEQGHGTMRWNNGNTYEGEWTDGQRCGYGTMRWADGRTYTGQWKDDAMTGYGTLDEDGHHYEGEFVKGQRHGKGTYTWPNGCTYTGDFVKGLRHGQGTYTWPEGDKYEGGWQDGLREGFGRYTFANGAISEGLWHQDKFQTK